MPETPDFTAVLDAALDQGTIRWYDKMCEPGYAKEGAVYLLGNWNNHDQDFQEWLEKEKKAELLWEDEWDSCENCGGLIRNTHDSYSWKLYGLRHDCGGITCGDCLKKDLPAYFKLLEGKSTKAVMLDVDPTQHGYVLVNKSDRYGDRFQNGWHPGQTDSPDTMSKALRLTGISRFLWRVPSVGQFDVDFVLYLHEDEKDKLQAARAAVGIKE